MTNSPHSLQLEIQTGKTDSEGVLHLRGDFSIQQNGTMKSMLIDALDDFEIVALNLEELSSIDLIAIQTLFAAFQYAQEKEVEFQIDGEVPQVFISAVEAAGLSSHHWLCFD